MESKIIIINGPAGVGKTTISKEVAKHGRNSACIQGDHLRHYIVNSNKREVETGLGYKNAAAVATNFINGGYELVVYDYIFEDKTSISKFANNLKVNCPVYLFTLCADKETVRKREASRQSRERLGERVSECYDSISKSREELGVIIETKEKTPQEIAIEVLKKVENKEGLLEYIISKQFQGQ